MKRQKRLVPVVAIILILTLIGVWFFLDQGAGDSGSAQKQLAAVEEKTAAETIAVEQMSSMEEAVIAPMEVGAAVPVEEAPQEVAPEEEVAPVEPVVILHGRVTSKATGDGIVNAHVRIFPLSTRFVSEERPVAAAETTTDKDGNYRITSNDLIDGKFTSLPMQSIASAEAEGFATRGAVMRGKQDDHRMDFSLDYGGTVTGRVLNENQEPIADAAVGNLILEQPNFEAMLQGIPTLLSAVTTSDADGNFTLTGIPEAGEFKLPARAKGYLPGTAGPFKAGERDVVITLKRGDAKMHGRVLRDDLTPIPNAMIVALPQNLVNSMAVVDVMSSIVMTKADENGNYRFDALAAGILQFQVVEEVDSIMPKSHEEKLELKAGDDLEHDFIFRAALMVRGRAIDSKTGEGIAGVKFSTQPYERISFMPAGMEREADHSDETVSEADGSFEIASIVFGGGNAGFYYHPPSGWITEEQIGVNMHIFQFTPNMTEYRTDIKFHRGATLTGRVVDSGNLPVAGAEVRCHGDGAGFSVAKNTKTKEDGTFELTVDFGKELTVEAYAEQGHAQAKVSVPADTNPEPVELKLGEYATVSGKVTNGRGEPLSGVAIRVQPNFQVQAMTWFVDINATTDAQGRYTVNRVPAGGVNITASPVSQEGYSASKPMSLTLKAGEKAEDINFVLIQGDALRGTITDEDDQPVAGASIFPVYYNNRPQGLLTGQSGSDGKYEVRGLPVEQQIDMIVVHHPQYEQETRQNVSIYDGPQDFVLKKLKSLTLIAMDGNTNRPVTHYSYRALQRVGEEFIVNPLVQGAIVTDSQGRATVDQVRNGVWRFEVAELDDENNPTGRRGTVDFDWPKQDGTSEVTVLLAGGKNVTGRVVLQSDSSPVADAEVSIGHDAESIVFAMPKVKTDSNGRFTAPGIPIGTYQVRVKKGDLQPSKKIEFTVTADRDPDTLEIELVSAGSIFGKVIDFDGNPVAGASVGHAFAGSTQTPATTGPNGSYRIDGAVAGTHMVSYSSPDFPQTKSVTVAPGEEKEVNFDFSRMIEVSGTLKRGGESVPPGQVLGFSMKSMDAPRDAEYMTPSRMTRDGDTYKIYVPAGDYYVQDVIILGYRSAVDEVTISEQPRKVQRDFNIQLADTDIIIVMPQNEKFKSGTIVLEQRGKGETPLVTQDIKVATETKRMTLVAYGQYRARFLSDDNKFSGSSDWTELIPGEENALIVDIGAKELRRIGGWTALTITTDVKAHSFALGDLVSQAGVYEIIADFEQGAHGVSIEGARLLRDGRVIAEDMHIGWTGTSNRNNTYRLPVNQYVPGQYSVEVMLRSDGGVFSTGSVFAGRE